MQVLRVFKCFAYSTMAFVYWLLANGFHEPWLYACLTHAYFLLLSAEATKQNH